MPIINPNKRPPASSGGVGGSEQVSGGNFNTKNTAVGGQEAEQFLTTDDASQSSSIHQSTPAVPLRTRRIVSQVAQKANQVSQQLEVLANEETPKLASDIKDYAVKFKAYANEFEKDYKTLTGSKADLSAISASAAGKLKARIEKQHGSCLLLFQFKLKQIERKLENFQNSQGTEDPQAKETINRQLSELKKMGDMVFSLNQGLGQLKEEIGKADSAFSGLDISQDNQPWVLSQLKNTSETTGALSGQIEGVINPDIRYVEQNVAILQDQKGNMKTTYGETNYKAHLESSLTEYKQILDSRKVELSDLRLKALGANQMLTSMKQRLNEHIAEQFAKKNETSEASLESTPVTESLHLNHVYDTEHARLSQIVSAIDNDYLPKIESLTEKISSLGGAS